MKKQYSTPTLTTFGSAQALTQIPVDGSGGPLV
jgi:hypothetical protein